MITNMNFYNFMHKQILVVIALLGGTGLGYIFMGYMYNSFLPELLWYGLVLLTSLWGYSLYKQFLNTRLSL